MTCCGQERTTAFCPDCGKAMANAGETLLAYLRQQQGQARRCAEEAAKRSAEPGNDWRNRNAKGVVRKNKVACKWDAWVEWMEATMKSEGGQ